MFQNLNKVHTLPLADISYMSISFPSLSLPLPPPLKFYALMCVVGLSTLPTVWSLLFAYLWSSLSCPHVLCIISNLVIEFFPLKGFRWLFGGRGAGEHNYFQSDIESFHWPYRHTVWLGRFLWFWLPLDAQEPKKQSIKSSKLVIFCIHHLMYGREYFQYRETQHLLTGYQ